MDKEMFINEKATLAAEIEVVEKSIAELQASIADKKDDLRILDRLQAKYFPEPIEPIEPVEEIIAEETTTDEAIMLEPQEQ